MSPRYIDDATLHAREQEILDRALDIISSNGIVALTMDKLVASVSFSKGTVYKHFSSKEDVFAGLCNRNMKSVAGLFMRAASISGVSSRDRMAAIGFAYMLSALLSPQNFTLVMHAKTEMFEKASDARRNEHDKMDSQLFGILGEIIESAIVAKELVLQPGVDTQQVSFSLWAMSFGTISLLLNGETACSSTSGLILENRVVEHGNMVMDGLGWSKGNSQQKDLINRLKSEVFLNEVEMLAKRGIVLG